MRKMRFFLILTFLLCACAGKAAARGSTDVLRSRTRALGDDHYSLQRYKVLREGRYKCVVAGVLCNACTRAVVEGLKKIKGIKDAKFDFEDGFLWLYIEENAQVSTRKIRRALAHAGRRVDLGTRYQITDIRFVP